MKTRILKIVISFIFLSAICFNTLYATTDEIKDAEKMEETQNHDFQNQINDTKEEFIESTNEVEDDFVIIETVDTTLISNNHQGTMCIDTPTSQQTFIRPDNDQITIQGWAVSDDMNATLRVLLDGNIITENLSRTSRPDVDSIISPNYGGIQTTPNAGFIGTINVSSQNTGIHYLKVEEISQHGTTITYHEIPIYIENKNFQGTMCIDTPTSYQTFTRPDDDQITIKGWAVSDDTNTTLRVLIDGNIVTENLNRTSRPDVDSIISPHYGGTKTTPKAGFQGTINVSNQKTGIHYLKVEEISRYGVVVAYHEIPIRIENKNFQGMMCIDTPTSGQTFTRPDEAQITVKGWAVSDDINTTLRILLDGNVITENISRTSRSDVDTIISPNYGGAKTTPKAGFEATIDVNHQNTGIHYLKVEEISRYGVVVAYHEIPIQIVNKKYEGTMYIDTPTNGQSFIRPEVRTMTLEGWAVSNDAKATVRILLDGNIIVNNVPRTQRPDVDIIISPHYGGATITPKAGFSNVVDISNLNTGVHSIRIEEISRYGDLIGATQTNFQIVNQTYLGEMCIDTPTFHQTYISGENMNISGWAVAQDEFATVEIYIDNVWKASASRYIRQDVAFFTSKYGGKTAYPGFGKMISTAGMSAGVHTLTVYEKSRYGDMIGGVEVKFIVRTINHSSDNSSNNGNSNNDNTTTPTPNPSPSYQTSGTKGIDVSQYQGTIDWSKVAKSDVKFAMIRIGYRAYGTGALVEDSRFKTNFKNAVASGLKVGVYFYSAAVSAAEAKQDADYVVSLLRKYGYQNQVSMPIALDLELVSGVNTRDRNVSRSVRTSIANTFSSTIASYGYTPMLYACKSFLNDNMNASQISCDVWVAQYNSKCTYKGNYTMWQYSSTGKVPGINGNVDCNICYKNY